MKKTATKNANIFIMDDLKKGRFVRINKVNGLRGYIRFVPLHKILKLLDQYNVKHPVLLKNRFKYWDIEYIDGKPLSDEFDKNISINVFCNAMYEMQRIKCDDIAKYIKWKNNTGFLYYNVNNMLKIYDRFRKNYDILEEFGIRRTLLSNFLDIKLDDSRRQTFIHGNLSNDNVVVRNNEYYFIDWDLATYGDLAYELAMHFSTTNYTEDEQHILIDRLSKSLGINEEGLVKDVKIYTDFDNRRKCILKMNKAIMLAKKGRSYEPILMEAYKYYTKSNLSMSLEDMRNRLRNLSLYK